MTQSMSESARKEIMDYVEQISRVRSEHIKALLCEYFERMNPDPEEIVLVEEHIGLKTIWYFSTKYEQGMRNK